MWSEDCLSPRRTGSPSQSGENDEGCDLGKWWSRCWQEMMEMSSGSRKHSVRDGDLEFPHCDYG